MLEIFISRNQKHFTKGFSGQFLPASHNLQHKKVGFY